MDMETLKKLIEAQNHTEILNLEDGKYAKFRGVAAIFLYRFEEALLYVEKGSFEHAYALYGLKRYRKALSVLKGHSSPRTDILKSQCLYNLGYYAGAYKYLRKHGCADEHAVNLTAIESICKLTGANSHRISYFTAPRPDSIDSKVSKQFTNPECLMEAEYNRLFADMDDQRHYLNSLYELDKKYDVADSCIKKQIALMTDAAGGDMKLSKRERETFQFNAGSEGAISHPVHFQLNFIPLSQHCRFIEHARNDQSQPPAKKFCWDYNNIQPSSELSLIIKSLACIKRGKLKNERIPKWLGAVSDCPEKKLLLALSSDLNNKECQKKAVSLLMDINK